MFQIQRLLVWLIAWLDGFAVSRCSIDWLIDCLLCSRSYASDRKHTKVDFPEARILEETLNVLLYEQNVDTELLQATRSRQRVNYNDEDDEKSVSVNSANVQVVRRLALGPRSNPNP